MEKVTDILLAVAAAALAAALCIEVAEKMGFGKKGKVKNIKTHDGPTALYFRKR